MAQDRLVDGFVACGTCHMRMNALCVSFEIFNHGATRWFGTNVQFGLFDYGFEGTAKGTTPYGLGLVPLIRIPLRDAHETKAMKARRNECSIAPNERFKTKMARTRCVSRVCWAVGGCEQ